MKRACEGIHQWLKNEKRSWSLCAVCLCPEATVYSHHMGNSWQFMRKEMNLDLACVCVCVCLFTFVLLGAGAAEVHLHQRLRGPVWEVASGQPHRSGRDLCRHCTATGIATLLIQNCAIMLFSIHASSTPLVSLAASLNFLHFLWGSINAINIATVSLFSLCCTRLNYDHHVVSGGIISNLLTTSPTYIS